MNEMMRAMRVPFWQRAAPETNVAALQATDAIGGTSSAAFVDNGLAADAGPDQSVNLGSATSFSGSYTDNTGGTVSASGINWDFNYDGTNFVADPAGAGTLTPSYTYRGFAATKGGIDKGVPLAEDGLR
jgi:hypothetical protein